MKLECVCSVSMCDLGLQVCGQVDDSNSLKRTSADGVSSEMGKDPDATHFLTQIPQPIHKNSEMKAILSLDLTSIQSLPGHIVSHYLAGLETPVPILTTGHD